MSLRSTLTVGGLILKPWWRNAEQGTSHETFVFGTCHGMLDIKNDIHLIAVANEAKGNGQFDRLMGVLENCATGNGVALLVFPLLNDRLYAWYQRRGYTVAATKQFGRVAIYPPLITNPDEKI